VQINEPRIAFVGFDSRGPTSRVHPLRTVAVRWRRSPSRVSQIRTA